MWPNLQFPVDLVTFTEEILNGKLHFLCSFNQVIIVDAIKLFSTKITFSFHNRNFFQAKFLRAYLKLETGADREYLFFD